MHSGKTKKINMLLLMASLLSLSGCATASKQDWHAPSGITYDGEFIGP